MKAFVARQPIFDTNQNVFAYELLYRDGIENVFRHADENIASSKVLMDSFHLMDIENLTNGKIAFINVTNEILIKEYINLFPKELIAVEILETVILSEKIIKNCRDLKNKGYTLILDDYVYNDEFDPIIEFVDIIKVDVLATTKVVQGQIINKFAPKGKLLLAEKIETKEGYLEAVSMGYSYFQGYFFSKPSVHSSKVIPGSKIQYLNLLQEIQQIDIDFSKIENIIKQDLSLSYKILRYINSAYFGLSVKIKSIIHAISMLGKRELKNWITLVTIANIGVDKPEELIIQSIVRAKFCELIAPIVGLMRSKDDLFFIGMFSLIDAIVDRPIQDVIKEIPLKDDVKKALLGEKNNLWNVLEIVKAYEKANWDRFSEIIHKLGLDESKFPVLYNEAVEWSTQSADILREPEKTNV